MTARKLALLGIVGVGLGLALAERAPAAKRARQPAAASARAGAAPASLRVPALRPVDVAAPVDRVDENGDPIIRTGRFAGWTHAQWTQWYGARLDQMRHELTDTEQVLARGCTSDASDACLDEVATARVRARDLRIRIDVDESDLASLAQAR